MGEFRTIKNTFVASMANECSRSISFCNYFLSNIFNYFIFLQMIFFNVFFNYKLLGAKL
jgi:hypothetical protein